MSGFGRPPGGLTFSPTPPERGSFPLDHDGECKPVMKEYLACLKKVKGDNDMACRLIAKEYLKCRMERNLMAPDTFDNLGFQEKGHQREKTSLDLKLDELKRENEELIKKKAAAAAAAAAEGAEKK